MKLWQKMALATLAVVLILGVRVYFVWKARQDPGVVTKKSEEAKPMTDDELSFVKQNYFATFDQAKALEGTSVWIKAG
jgi:predicted negative regulator of RcsB-dependent stress response